MDQEAWNQIYSDLERDIGVLRKRGRAIDEMSVILEIDRARFALDRGDDEEAIAHIQSVKEQLRGPDSPITRGAPSSPSTDRLDALEDRLHSSIRLGSASLDVVGEDEEEPTRAASQNTKVNKSITYEDIRSEFTRMWSTCKIRPEKDDAVRQEADRVVKNREIYEEISAETQVPWWFIGLIHGMECSFSLNKHLHNGDSLKARTWQVPAGRPKSGNPPFTFQESAIDALTYDGFAGKTDWPLEMVLYRLERYNGFGYRKKYGFASPYLWSYTNHFTSGKYVKDGVFDPNAVSKQCGAAAMLRDLVERGIVSFEEKKPEPVVVPAPKPEVSPAPAVVPAPEPVAAQTPPAAPSATPSPAPAPAPAPVAAPAQDAPAAEPDKPVAQPSAAPAATTASPVPAPAQEPVSSAPASTPPAVPAAASAGPANDTGASDGAISPAVAAALAELAKRPK